MEGIADPILAPLVHPNSSVCWGRWRSHLAPQRVEMGTLIIIIGWYLSHYRQASTLSEIYRLNRYRALLERSIVFSAWLPYLQHASRLLLPRNLSLSLMVICPRPCAGDRANRSRTYDTNRPLVEHYWLMRIIPWKVERLSSVSAARPHHMGSALALFLLCAYRSRHMTDCSLALRSVTKSRARYQNLLIHIVF